MNQNNIKNKVIGIGAVIILIIIVVFLVYSPSFDIKEKKEAVVEVGRIKTGVTNALLRENEELLDQGKLKEAIDNYKNISQLNPDNLSVIKQSAFVDDLFLIKNSLENKEEYKKLEEKLNNNEQTLVVKLGMQLAIVAAKQGEYQRAIQYLESYKIFTENNSPKTRDYQSNQMLSSIIDRQSYYYLYLGDIAKAKELNSKSLSLMPDNSWAHYTKSFIIMEENPDNKKEALKEARLAYDSFQETYSKNYIKYLSISKKMTESYFLFRLGNMYYLNNNLKEAEKYLIEAIATIGDMQKPKNYIPLARLYLDNGDYLKTREYLNKWEKNDKKAPLGYFVKAKLNLALGNKKEAQTNFTTALNLLDTLSPPDLIILPRAKSLLKNNIIGEINKLNKNIL